MSNDVISAILAVALVLLVSSAFKSTRHVLWQSVLHPFRKDDFGDDDSSRGLDNSEASQRNRP